ncbi:MAG TPA: DUF72 domain-containing protein [Armatimonadota bacterium]|nr:DUF72 domain-containing protein [Armatimonadota bacterium]HOM72392.1 DUF72 domain-containing protein [Armatimonadota bacterium]HPP75429.1 DUF72 domain-containing protein [Armatimonadota bacterium]
MAGRFYCGTSGWNYKHWKGIFYPNDLPQSNWLEYYSRFFDTVEINNSFYRLPSKETFETWRRQAPSEFTFAVKASRYLTHMKKLSNPEEPLERILEHSSGLGEKQGPMLYQLPPYWHVNLERLESFLKILPKHLRHVIEFRDSTWHNTEVFNLLKKYNTAYCIMSAPDLPLHLVTTSDFSYIRMHNGGYDTEVCYTDDALAWWAEYISSLLNTGDIYIYFNNDYKGYAVANALTLKQLL